MKTLFLPPAQRYQDLRYAELRDCRIAYDTFGEPKNPAILLIMGLGAQMWVWPEALCQALADAGHYVVRFDNRDIGSSSKHPSTHSLRREYVRRMVGHPVRSPYRLETMAADCLGLMDWCGLQKAHIVGASMGGMLAQILSACKPQRVSSLTLMMTSCGFLDWGRTACRMVTRALLSPPAPRPVATGKTARESHSPAVFGDYTYASMTSREPETLKKTSLIRAVGSQTYPTPDRSIQERLRLISAREENDWRGTRRQLLAMLATGSLEHYLPHIKARTLVLHGDEDPLIPARYGRELSRKIAGANFELIQGMGHDFPEPLLARTLRLLLGHIQAEQTSPSFPWTLRQMGSCQ